MNFSSEMNHCELNNDTHPHTLMFISHLSLEFTKTQNNSEDKFSDTRPVTFTCLYIFRLPYFRERNYLFVFESGKCGNKPALKNQFHI